MIRTLAREARVVPLLTLAVAIGAASVIMSQTSLGLPLVPRGIPASWIAATLSCILLALPLAPTWDASVLSMRRIGLVNASRLVHGIVLAAIAYVPWIPSADPGEPQAWAALAGATLVAASISTAHYWAVALFLAIGFEVWNAASLGDIGFVLLSYREVVIVIAALLLASGVVLSLSRMRKPQWYRDVAEEE